MTAYLLPSAKQQYFNAAGDPLSGGKVYTYAAGTSTPKATYTDSSAGTPNANPVVLDARGEGSIFWTGAYKVTLKDSAGSTIWTVDNVTATDVASLATYAALAAAGGAALVGTADGSNVQADLDNAAKLAMTARNAFTITPTGNLPVDTTDLFYGMALNVRTTSDTAVSAATPGAQIPSLVNVEHYFGGTAINDGRNALGCALHMTAATKSTNTYRFYAGVNVVSDTAFNDGGTGVTPAGTIYGVGGVARLKSGATYWSGAFPADFEIAIETGASVQRAAIVSTLTWPSHAVNGTLVDAHIWSSGAGAGMLNGWQVDNNAGAAPIATSGTLIKALGGWTLTNGLDMSGVTVSSYLIKGPTTGGHIQYGGIEVTPSKTIAVPLTGDTVTIGATKSRTIINPAGTLANLTIVLPTAVADGDLRHVTFTQAITTLAWTGTTSGFPTTMARNSRISAIWDSGSSTWYLA